MCVWQITATGHRARCLKSYMRLWRLWQRSRAQHRRSWGAAELRERVRNSWQRSRTNQWRFLLKTPTKGTDTRKKLVLKHHVFLNWTVLNFTFLKKVLFPIPSTIKSNLTILVGFISSSSLSHWFINHSVPRNLYFKQYKKTKSIPK